MKIILPTMLALSFLGSCGLFEPPPSEEFAPFIQVNVVDPQGFVAPLGETWEVTTSAIINGNFITNTNEITEPANPLPSDFTVSFSEQVRGQNVTVLVEGFTNGFSVFTASGVGTAGSDSIEVVARFCGDNGIDDDRSEECDDGPNNSDIAPNACRTDCSSARCGDGILDSGEACDDGVSNSDTVADACRLDCALPSCGDGTVDTGEECDDSNIIDADGCEADCTLPACGNGILDPEDFEGNLCYQEALFATGGFPKIIKIIDIDGDNLQDVLQIVNATNSLVISFGDGLGGISEIKTIPLNSNVFIPVIGFFGGNQGSRDIAVSGVVSNAVIIKHTAPRNFVTSVTPSTNTPIQDIVAGDFDNDGKDDLIVVTGAGGVQLYKQNNNSFNSPSLITMPLSGFGPVSIESSDMNGDGLPDLAILQSLSDGSSSLVTAKNRGDGTFTFNSIDLPGISSNSSRFESLVIFDQGSDGIPEILVADTDSPNSAIISINNVSPDNIQPFITSATIERISSTDLDLDGEPDFIFYTAGSKLKISLSSRNFQEQQIFTSLAAFSAVAAGDINQDGIPDIISGDAVSVQNPSGMLTFTFNE